jgi:hypothetical protein
MNTTNRFSVNLSAFAQVMAEKLKERRPADGSAGRFVWPRKIRSFPVRTAFPKR